MPPKVHKPMIAPPKAASPKLTHFLCIPLHTPTTHAQIASTFSVFQHDFRSQSTLNPSGVPGKAFRPIQTLHLTLGVMSLQSKERIDGAVSLLQSLDISELYPRIGIEMGEVQDGKTKETVAAGCTNTNNARHHTPQTFEERDQREESILLNLSPPPSQQLRITLRGLQSMHTPSKTSVLYTSPVDPDQRLQKFCTALRVRFTDAGFVVPDSRPLLLHATLVNTIYVPGARERSEQEGRRRGGGGRGGGGGGGAGHGKRRAKLVFDASDILQKYHDYEWLSGMRVDRITICKMGAKKGEGEGDSGGGEEAYEVVGEVMF